MSGCLTRQLLNKISTMQLVTFKYQQHFPSPIEADYYGNFHFDESRLAVILNSRQSKTPTGNDPWITNTFEAVRWAVKKGYVLITGIGMNTWELVCWACGNCAGRQVIVCPVESSADINQIVNKIVDDFGLDRNRTGWLFFAAMQKAKSSKVDWPKRDRLAISHANIFIPVSLRPDGNLEMLLKQYLNGNKNVVIDDFKVGYQGRVKKYKQVITKEDLNPKISNMPWDYVTHWTRTHYGAYPDETSKEFYSKLVNSGDYYLNSAINTLKQILVEKKIKGSTHNIKDGMSVVAFSSLRPEDVLPLMRWRARYVRWSFEPYGIAISTEMAKSIGLRPVIYGKPSLYETLTEQDKPFFQSQGVKGGDWCPENEWRHIGDLDLSDIKSSDMKIIVGKSDEVKAIGWFTESEVISLT